MDGTVGTAIGSVAGAGAGAIISAIPGMQPFAPALIGGGAMIGGNIGGMDARAQNLSNEADYFARVAAADRQYLQDSDDVDAELEWQQYQDSIKRYKEAQLVALTPNKGHYNMPWRIS